MLVETPALILSSIKYGDTSKIISVYSRDYGKINLIAKGAFTAKSKFGASIEPFSLTKLSFNYNPNKTLYTLRLSDFYFNPKNLLKDNYTLAFAMMILESIKYSKEENHENIELFLMIENTIQALDKKEINPFVLYTNFMLNLCRELGFELNFAWKNKNEKENANDIVFCSLENCRLVSNALNLNGAKIAMEIKDLEFMRDLQNNFILYAEKNEFERLQIFAIITFFEKYLALHLDKKFHFNSKELLNY